MRQTISLLKNEAAGSTEPGSPDRGGFSLQNVRNPGIDSNAGAPYRGTQLAGITGFSRVFTRKNRQAVG